MMSDTVLGIISLVWLISIIWLVLVILKPSKFLFFLKPEVKWRRLKTISCWCVAACLLGVIMVAIATREHTDTSPEAATSMTKEDTTKHQIYVFLKPQKKWYCSGEGYESKPDIGIESVDFLIGGQEEPEIEGIFYNKTANGEEAIWELEFYSCKTITQIEHIMLPAKSIVRFYTKCKHNPTMRGTKMAYALHKVNEPGNRVSGKQIDPWKNSTYELYEEVMYQLHGVWRDGNYEFAVNDTYFSGWEYTVEQAYIDGPWIYAWLKMKNGGTTAVRAWKIKDAGPVYNAMIFWNASKPEPLVQPCLRVR